MTVKGFVLGIHKILRETIQPKGSHTDWGLGRLCKLSVFQGEFSQKKSSCHKEARSDSFTEVVKSMSTEF